MVCDNCWFAWAAGVVEADGCIMFKVSTKSRGGLAPRIRVTMADEDIVRALHSVLGAGRIRGPLSRSYSDNPNSLKSLPKNPKPLYLWEVNKKKEVLEVLLRLRPFLHRRRGAKADEVIKFLGGGIWSDGNPRGMA